LVKLQIRSTLRADRNELSIEAWPLVLGCQEAKPTGQLNNFVLAHFIKVRQQVCLL